MPLPRPTSHEDSNEVRVRVEGPDRAEDAQPEPPHEEVSCMHKLGHCQACVRLVFLTPARPNKGCGSVQMTEGELFLI
jgi:hypothetical protein